MPARTAIKTLLRGRWWASSKAFKQAPPPQWRPDLSAGQAARLLARASQQPTVSIVTPVYKVAPQWLARCIESVRAQYYSGWELLLVDDASRDAALTRLMKHYAAADSRIRLIELDANAGIAQATNRGIQEASGSYIGFLDHDDELTPDALAWFVLAHNRNPGAVWFYSDEDLIDTSGNCFTPFFKPDYSPIYLLGTMYTCHFSVYSADLLRRAGGLRPGFDGSQDHDLALRLSEMVRADQVVHIPRILYHWRTLPSSTAGNVAAKPQAATAGERAVGEALARRGIEGQLRASPVCATHYQVVPRLKSSPKVTIVIPTYNGLDDLRTCVTSLRQRTSYPNYDVVVIDNRSDDPQLLQYLDDESAAGRLKVMKYPLPFNHSDMNNRAVAASGAEFAVLMNNDVELLSDGWLETLVATAQMDPSIAGVGTLLLYPDGTIQHAGIIYGVHGLAGHALRNLPAEHPGYFGRGQVLHEVSGATAALLLVRCSAFQAVGGFNAERYPAVFNDVDLWLKLRTAGYRCVYNPLVKAIHYESKSRGREHSGDAVFHQRLIEDWGDELLRDPYYNPNLAVNEHFEGRRPYPVEADFPELAGVADDEQPSEPVIPRRRPVAHGIRLVHQFHQHCRAAGLRAALKRTGQYISRQAYRRLLRPAAGPSPPHFATAPSRQPAAVGSPSRQDENH